MKDTFPLNIAQSKTILKMLISTPSGPLPTSEKIIKKDLVKKLKNWVEDPSRPLSEYEKEQLH